ncbi:hypothetical protein CHS0354_004449 [Potamilus streckersoni]|uniref:Uncharacterized protein n=1 Tax=Potamilus streckersoni TaxID=2493646 RepID=A0AAE0SPI2_9BIVA|nr:hypothetical protein CHS0354_004449 [Potamilus streckersoni]
MLTLIREDDNVVEKNRYFVLSDGGRVTISPVDQEVVCEERGTNIEQDNESDNKTDNEIDEQTESGHKDETTEENRGNNTDNEITETDDKIREIKRNFQHGRRWGEEMRKGLDPSNI